MMTKKDAFTIFKNLMNEFSETPNNYFEQDRKKYINIKTTRIDEKQSDYCEILLTLYTKEQNFAEFKFTKDYFDNRFVLKASQTKHNSHEMDNMICKYENYNQFIRELQYFLKDEYELIRCRLAIDLGKDILK